MQSDQLKGRWKIGELDNDDDIVISGISGRFPESDNIDELNDNLYNHVDMVTEDNRRCPIGKLFL